MVSKEQSIRFDGFLSFAFHFSERATARLD